MELRGKAIALVAAVAVFCCLVAAVCLLLPSATSLAQADRGYSYVYSGAKSTSVDFVVQDMGEDSMLFFGSSELSTPANLIPEVPAVVFGRNPYGLQLSFVGEAYDQSLWQALAAGAYARQVQNKKIAIVASPSWFFDGGVDNSVFQTRFSYSLYRSFMANGRISDECRAYVRARLLEQGIDESVVRAGERGDAVALVNDVAYAFADDLRLRNNLRSIADEGIERISGREVRPDFAQWRAHALEDAKQRSTNEWGFDDDFYEQNVGAYKDQIKGKLSGETFSDTPEYDDFGLFLRVCQDCGLEPLVIIAPLSGDYYDWVGIDAATRASCYGHIRQIAEAYGVAVADFSGKEYERYFLHDQVHFGWTGWVDVEQAVYEFAKGD